jgi:hypothetical protein
MSTIPPGKPSFVTPQDDIYVTLLVTSAIVLLFGIIFVAVRSYQLFGSIWPPAGA